ncbi:putative membrane protein YgcG [Clostridium saccharobutylicum]|nr:putative membrane protein YgcG [Clostridium saccharobutylicum]
MRTNTKIRFLNLFICFLLLVSSLLLISVNAEIKIPSPTSYKYVNDYVNVINEAEVNKIISIGKELEDKTGAQAVVAVINSTNNVPIEDYAINLFRNWGIGQKIKITVY